MLLLYRKDSILSNFFFYHLCVSQFHTLGAIIFKNPAKKNTKDETEIITEQY